MSTYVKKNKTIVYNGNAQLKMLTANKFIQELGCIKLVIQSICPTSEVY